MALTLITALPLYGHVPMKKISLWLSPLLLGIALWAIHHELKEIHGPYILAELKLIPLPAILLAVLLTGLDFLVLTFCEVLSFKSIQKPLHYSKIALSSFVAYAFGNSVGFSGLSSSSVRYRFYTAWQFSALDIAKLVIFSNGSFILGFFTLASVFFILAPLQIPVLFHLPLHSTQVFGILFLMTISGYFLFCSFQKKPVRIKGAEFSLPPLSIATAQIGLMALDLAVAASVLYVLLPARGKIEFPGFMAVYLLAIGAGFLSQIPGGLGVFESIVLLALPEDTSKAAVLSSLLAYRLIYYLLPLTLAALFLGAFELRHQKETLKEISDAVSNFISHISPHVISLAVFLGGVVLLFSGATPAAAERLHWLKNFFPLPLVEISHLSGSLAGASLLVLAWGLQKRLDGAYAAAIGLLLAGIVFSLLKGLDYEEAIILGLMLAILIPAKRHFYRKASFFHEPFSKGWLIAVLLVLGSSAWLGFFTYRHVNYSDALWWKFTFDAEAPRFLRSTFGSIVFIFLFAIGRLISPVRIKTRVSTAAEIEKVRTLVLQNRRASGNLALLGDKSFLFSDNGAAVLMYGIQGKSWVALGNPLGPEKDAQELIWQFHERVDQHGGRTVFYDISKENLYRYLDLGLVPFKTGEEARVELAGFSLEGPQRKELRHIVRHFEKQECTFEIAAAAQAASMLPELKQISDDWLRRKKTSEKGFSLGFFNPEYLVNFPIALVRKKEKVIAFANVWLGAEKYELSVDLMRYLVEEAPGGVMDYLFTQLMLWGSREGYQEFNLGVAPLSGLEDHSLAPFSSRFGAFLFNHGEHFYNFRGLRNYKEKFFPRWEPKYLLSPGGLSLPAVLTDVATLISGGLKGVVSNDRPNQSGGRSISRRLKL